MFLQHLTLCTKKNSKLFNITMLNESEKAWVASEERGTVFANATDVSPFSQMNSHGSFCFTQMISFRGFGNPKANQVGDPNKDCVFFICC